MSQRSTSQASALVRFPSNRTQTRQWLQFSSAIGSTQTNALGDVVACLAKVEQAVSNGLWAVGYLSYDASPAFDPKLVAHCDLTMPLVSFYFFDQPTILATLPPPRTKLLQPLAWEYSHDQALYNKKLQQIKEYIEVGDTYQVNYTLRLAAKYSDDPYTFFHLMHTAQQAKYSVYLDFGRHKICSASPELFFHQHHEILTTKPMKGTAKRHSDPQLDNQLAQQLQSSEKNLAENTMIVDMARNDLGRICRYGSIETTKLHAIESYPTVHQMVSTVSGHTDASLVEVLHALFPAASITGAPKYRTSEIIAELETTPRGLYTGCIGAISPDGITEFNVAIRTAVIDTDQQKVSYGAGGGIVYDSNNEDEWQEMNQKTKIIVDSVT